jgi:hypothetical protein
MRPAFKLIGMVAILLAVGVAAWSFKDAIPLRGVLTEGSRFDVSIGDPYDDAHEALLSNGYRLFNSETGGLCVSAVSTRHAQSTRSLLRGGHLARYASWKRTAKSGRSSGRLN